MPNYSSISIPLNCPLHGAVCDDEGRDDVEDLVLRPPHGVEETLCESASERPHAVRANAVGDNAFARLASALVGIAPFADVVAVRL